MKSRFIKTIFISLSLGLLCAVQPVSAKVKKVSDSEALREWCQAFGWNQPYCDWFKKSDNSETNNQMQDLKNFLALSQLKQAKAESEMMFLKPPYLNTSIMAGYRDQQARAVEPGLKKAYQNYFTQWNLLLRPGVADTSSFLDDHRNNYCSKNEASVKLCSSSGHDTPLDLNASSLIGKSVYKTEAEQKAAGMYVQNLTNPIPVPLLPTEKLFTDDSHKNLTPEGKDNLTAKYRQQILISLAQDSLVNIMAERMPFLNLDGSNDGDPEKSKLSRKTLLDDEATRRFSSAAWHNEMATMSSEALLREISNMMALRLTMEARNSERLERIEALMAAQVSYAGQMIGNAEVGRQASEEVEQGNEDES